MEMFCLSVVWFEFVGEKLLNCGWLSRRGVASSFSVSLMSIPQFPFDEVEQRRDGLDIITKTEVQGIIRIDTDYLDFTRPLTRQLLKNGVKDLAGPAPGGSKHNQYRLCGLKNFRLEGRFCDGSV